MNAKALIEAYLDFPQEAYLRYNVRFSLIGVSGGGYLGTFDTDAYFTEADTVAQIKTKIRNAIIARALVEGHTVTSTNVGSIFQI
jgi:hypothetical protein